MTSISLSILIPTYNRAPLLKFLLMSICDDFRQWPDDLELIVIDNASTDETPCVAAGFIERGVPLKFIGNEQNIGMDANLAGCFGSATGKYFWQIGDDEILYQGLASYVLSFCRTNDVGLLHVCSNGFLSDQQSYQRACAIPSRVNSALVDSLQLIRLANVYLTFISANVVNRQAILENNPDFDCRSEKNSYLPQLAWIFAALKVRNVHQFIATPMFGALSGNTGGYNLVEVFCTNFTDITRRHLSGIMPEACSIVSNAALLRVIPAQLWTQSGDKTKMKILLNNDVFTELNRIYKDNRYFNWLVHPLFSSNSWKRNVAFLAIRVFNWINRLCGFRFF